MLKTHIFEEFNLELPHLTLLVLTLSQWIITSGWIMALVILLLAGGALLFSARHLLPASVRDWLAGRLATPLGRKAAIARFAQFTAELLQAGMDIPSAVRIAGATTKRPRLRTAAWRLANEMESGGDQEQSTDQRALSATVLHALQADMPTVSRIRLLREVGDCHAERARVRLSWTRGIIEPITICVIGILVGATVIAMFLPLVRLVEGLSR